MNRPIKKLNKKVEDKSKDYRIIFSILTGQNSHILTIVIVGHLLIEYLLDKIITTKFKNTKKVVGKSFAEKIKLLYPTWLPLFLFKNIKLLNEIRNGVAHNLGVVDYKPVIHIPNGELRTLKIPLKKNKGKFYFNELINTILFDLVNYSYYSLGVSADIDLHQMFNLDYK